MATEMLDSLYTLIKSSTSQNTNPGSLETCACSDVSATPYSTFHRCLKVKCPVSGAKMHIQYMNVARFYYVGSCTYCNGSELKYTGSIAKKMYALSCWKTTNSLHQNQH